MKRLGRNDRPESPVEPLFSSSKVVPDTDTHHAQFDKVRIYSRA